MRIGFLVARLTVIGGANNIGTEFEPIIIHTTVVFLDPFQP